MREMFFETLLPCRRVWFLGSGLADFERTLSLAEDTCCVLQKEVTEAEELANGFGDLACAAFVTLPGEAVAGCCKTTPSLTASEAFGSMILARALLQTTPLFRALWRLFLRGCRVCIGIDGPGYSPGFLRHLQVFSAHGWEVQPCGASAACLYSPGVCLKGRVLCFTSAN